MKGDNTFYEKIAATEMLNSTERMDVVISLLNERHEPVMVWTVMRAFAVKIDGPQLKAANNEVAIEKLEIVHEGIVVSTP